MSTATMAYRPTPLANAGRAVIHGVAVSMATFAAVVRKVFSRTMADAAREREEAYLAQAADLYDLEHRIRELDKGHYANNWTGGLPR